MNQIEALRLIRARDTILQKASQFDMASWVLFKDGDEQRERPAVVVEPDCGTMFCIAGILTIQAEGVVVFDSGFFANALQALPVSGRTFSTVASSIIGVSEYEAGNLFFPWNWDLIDYKFSTLDPTAENAAIVINRFLERHGYTPEGELLVQVLA